MWSRSILLMLFFSFLAQAEPALEIQVYTASEGAFAVTSTLVKGEKDAILIDAQFSLSEAHRLVADILESKKNLTTVYITHSHPDHYWGLEVIRAQFPKARFVALPRTIASISATWKGKLAFWRDEQKLGFNLTEKPIIPQELKENFLVLENQKLEIVGELQGDEKDNSYVWIPSIKAVIGGDILYHGVYPWTLETTPEERKDWVATVERIEKLSPAIVVAGHKNKELANSPATLQFMKDYLAFFDQAVKKSGNADQLKKDIKAEFPGLKVDLILELAANAVFPKAAK